MLPRAWSSSFCALKACFLYLRCKKHFVLFWSELFFLSALVFFRWRRIIWILLIQSNYSFLNRLSNRLRMSFLFHFFRFLFFCCIPWLYWSFHLALPDWLSRVKKSNRPFYSTIPYWAIYHWVYTLKLREHNAKVPNKGYG